MKLTLNLASRRYVNERALKFSCLLISIILLGLLMFQVYGLLQGQQQQIALQVSIDQLTEKLQGKVPERFTAEQIAVQKKEYAEARAYLEEDAFRWTALFDRFEGLLPENVSIRSFNPNYEQGSLVISGVAKNLIDLQDLLDNLYADTFKQVYLNQHSQLEVPDYQGDKREALSFSIQIEGVF
jgi:type IV pilus assembly protein PilN